MTGFLRVAFLVPTPVMAPKRAASARSSRVTTFQLSPRMLAPPPERGTGPDNEIHVSGTAPMAGEGTKSRRNYSPAEENAIPPTEFEDRDDNEQPSKVSASSPRPVRKIVVSRNGNRSPEYRNGEIDASLKPDVGGNEGLEETTSSEPKVQAKSDKRKSGLNINDVTSQHSKKAVSLVTDSKSSDTSADQTWSEESPSTNMRSETKTDLPLTTPNPNSPSSQEKNLSNAPSIPEDPRNNNLSSSITGSENIPKKSTSVASERRSVSPSSNEGDTSQKMQAPDTPEGRKDIESKAEPVKTTLKMSPTQLEKAKQKKESEEKALAEKREKDALRVRTVISKAEQVLNSVGEKTGIFRLGRSARERLELTLDQAEKEASIISEKKVELSSGSKAATVEEKKAVNELQQKKLKGTAASAIKRLSGAFISRWDEQIIPALRNRLPKEYHGVGSKAAASAAVAGICAIFLFPVLFGGENNSVGHDKENNVIESQTSALEQKLSRAREQRASSMSESSSSSATGKTITSPFPPQQEAPTVSTPPVSRLKAYTRSSLSSKPVQTQQSSKSDPAATSTASSVEKDSGSAKDSASNGPSTIASGSPSQEKISLAAPSKPVTQESALSSTKTSQMTATVTEKSAVASIRDAVGQRAQYIASGSFDTLSPVPTIVVEVTREFRKMSTDDQRNFAVTALRNARSIGYEAVSVVEAGTDAELVHAGVDIDLEDETANLRSQLRAVQRKADNLATQSAKEEAELDAARERLDEERAEFMAKRSKLEELLKGTRAENVQLAEELREAKEELSQMPDRMQLEERTEAAEFETRKMRDTVDMLSRQVTLARDGELAAKRAGDEAVNRANSAEKDKQVALREIDDRVNDITVKLRKEADLQLSNYKQKADEKIAAAQREVVAANDALSKADIDFNRQIAEIRKSTSAAMENEVSRRQVDGDALKVEYERKLEDLRKQGEVAVAELKKQASSDTELLQQRLKSAEEYLAQSKAEAAKNLESLKEALEKSKAAEIASREKKLAEIARTKETELRTQEGIISSKYEKLLDELKKKFSVDLERAKAEAVADKNSLIAARKKAEKTESQAARDQGILKQRISTLEEKLRSKQQGRATPAGMSVQDEEAKLGS